MPPLTSGAAPAPSVAIETAPVVLEPIPDFAATEPSFGPRPVPAQPNVARSLSKQPPPPPMRFTGQRRSGTATWYCQAGVSACHHAYSSGLYAAAGPGLRVGDWRGRRVQVCAGGRCVIVRLIDWCACGGGSRLIDLYSDAFRRLAPLSAGTVRVTVRW